MASSNGHMTHGHLHQGNQVGENKALVRRFKAALVLNVALFAVTLAAGLLSGSLTLIGNAFHLVSDVAALAIGWISTLISARPPSERHSFGLARAEVLGALATTLLLVAGSGLVIYLSASRILAHTVRPVAGFDVGAVGAVGLVVNLVTIVLLANQASHSLLFRANVIHFASDSVGWLLALAVGIVMAASHFPTADSWAAIAISVLVIVASGGVFRDIAAVLLEFSPAKVDVARIREALLASDGVKDVHHLHVWNISSSSIALSAHLVMREEISLHQAQQHSLAIKQRLEENFGIDHATFELECHICEDPTHTIEH